jgi:hypothetical protein
MDLMRRRQRATASAVVASCAIALASCSSTTTATVSPTSDKCQISAVSTPSSFGAGGGAGSVTISTDRDCTWSIAADAPWLTVGGDRTGQGGSVVPYTVAANTIPAQRSGSIVVGTATVSVSQAGAPCRFDLSRSHDSIGASGGPLSVGVTTVAGCSWSAATAVPWIAVSSGQSGSASGTVGLTIAANAGGARTGTVNVAGQSYSIAQDGVAAPAPDPMPAPTPDPPKPPPSGPPPPPPPPPPAPKPVHFDGTLLSLSGTCPGVSFSVGDFRVVANNDTKYKHGSCTELSNGDSATIDGIPSGSTVIATQIDDKEGKHGDQ